MTQEPVGREGEAIEKVIARLREAATVKAKIDLGDGRFAPWPDGVPKTEAIVSCSDLRRLIAHAEGRFQSDKYPSLDPDKIVLSFKDEAAALPLRLLAKAYVEKDPELSADINARLDTLGVAPSSDDALDEAGVLDFEKMVALAADKILDWFEVDVVTRDDAIEIARLVMDAHDEELRRLGLIFEAPAEEPPPDPSNSDPLYGKRMDSADCGEEADDVA